MIMNLPSDRFVIETFLLLLRDKIFIFSRDVYKNNIIVGAIIIMNMILVTFLRLLA